MSEGSGTRSRNLWVITQIWVMGIFIWAMEGSQLTKSLEPVLINANRTLQKQLKYPISF